MKQSFLIAALLVLGSFLFALPGGYGAIRLGMGVDAVKDALEKDASFGYRGDRDVSFAPASRGKDSKQDDNVIIETDAAYALAPSFFSRCWFQFIDGKLSVITLNLNPQKIDHYSVFQTLCEKYGSPQELTPQKSVWADGGVRLSLERPLVLKYIDSQVANDKQTASSVEKTNTEKARDEFLEGL